MCQRHLSIALHCLLAVWILKSSFVTALGNYEYSKEKIPTIQDQKPILGEKLNASKWTKRSRTKRDIWQLYGVITCMTPCDPFVLKDYGCYCGLGGTGSPVDAIDRCCMLHDYCYHNTPCHQALTYFLPYNWKCVGRRPHCSLPARWSPAYTCAIQLCECDRMFSECLNSHGCPKNKAICNSSQVRHMWQKFLIKLGIG